MVRLIIGLVLAGIGLLGVFDAWLNPSAFQGSRAEPIIGFCAAFFLPGCVLAYFGRKARRREHRRPKTVLPEAKDSPAEALPPVFGMVVVIGKHDPASPFYSQAEAHLLEKISSAPNAKTIVMRVDTLPANRRAAVEPWVWMLQSRHRRERGRWQADFYDPLGLQFVVLYLE